MKIIKSSIIIILLLLSISFSFCEKSSSSIITMAEAPPSSSAPTSGYIVYTEQPPEGSDHDSFHLNTLSSVLGSEDAAKESLLYVYKNAATGFSAKLTPEQVSQLQKQPGVLQVQQSQSVKLH